MCGILGIILKDKFIDKQNLIKSSQVLKHRGPDATGIWISKNKKTVFSQVRLSIVDVGTRSNQPLVIDNENYVINFNGEIYDYMRLREMLIKKHNVNFKTKSDTEVIVQLYKYYGKKCLDFLDGMFAFAIYDKKKDEVFLARDFIGQKPLLYATDKNGFYFSSEIPSIFELNPTLSKEIDINSLKLYLVDNFFHIPAPYTIFNSIKKLEPTTYMIVKDGKIIEKKKYKTLSKSKNYTLNEDILKNKLKLMEPNEVSYGTFLSGGIDSSYISANLKKNNSNIKAYTLKVSKDDQDYLRSKYISNKLNLNQEIIDVDKIDMLKSIEKSIENYGEPYYHRTSIYADAILSEVKKEHKVMFTGAGGDEIYYGYDNLLFLKLDLFLKTKNYLPFIKFFVPTKYEFLKNSTKDNLKYNYLTSNLKISNGLFSKNFKNDKETKKYIDNIIVDFKKTVKYDNYIDFSYMFGLFVENSHSLTIQGDLIGMKNSIEIRSLFLEEDIIRNAYSIPLRKKLIYSNLHEGKKVLRNYLKPIFSKEFLYSKKIGFGVKSNAEKEMLKNNSKEIISKLEKLSKREYFNQEEILSISKNLEKNYNLTMKLYALEIWFEKFID